MSKEQNGLDRDATQPFEGGAEHRSNRRRLLKTGAWVVPTIMTLHAAPAWAATDYTMVAYRYGANAGLCRNPNFNPNANPNSETGQEFIPCPDSLDRGGHGRPHLYSDSVDETGDEGTVVEIAPQ